MDSLCPRDHYAAENHGGLDTNLLLNNVQTILVKIIMKLILIYLSNSFFQILDENEKQKTKCISISIFYENEKQMKALKIKSKNLF